jgi:hypothetical protein
MLCLMPMDMYLGLCYQSIIYGLPVMRLQKYADWERAHGRHDPPNEDLDDFQDYFDDAIQIFRNNNFAEEYATRYAANPESFPNHQAPLPRHSTSNIEHRLQSLRTTILTVGVEAVEHAIDQLLTAHREDDDELWASIRTFISHPHHIASQQVLIQAGAHFHISQLLDRLHNLL